MPQIVVSPRRRALVSGAAPLLLGWAVVALVVVAALTSEDHDPVRVLVFALVWLASTTVPGILVWRALCRPTSIVQEIGFGSVLGVGLLLLAWVPATLLGHPLLMWLWPIGLVATCAAVPSLRRHLRTRGAHQQPVQRRWQLAMMVIAALAFLRLWANGLQETTLPGRASYVFQDFWYEISLTARLVHHVAIDDPALDGVPLKYHWFSNAHAAALQSLSGATTSEVVMHLWPVAMLFTLVFAMAAAAQRLLQGADELSDVVTGTAATAALRRRWWVGPLAALLVAVLPMTWYLGLPYVRGVDNGFVLSSTSGILALSIVLALVGPVLDLLHGRARRGTWVLLGLLLLLSVGSKPSILPVVACGAALVTVVQWAQNRRFPRAPAALSVISLVLIPVSAVALIGSTGGSKVQLFDLVLLDRAYEIVTGGTNNLPGYGGILVPGLSGGSAQVWGVAAGLVLLFTLTELPRLIGILGLGDRTLRADPGLVWCSGVMISGFCGLWLLAHPAFSQHYFWRITIGLGVVLTVVTAVRLVPLDVRWKEVRWALLAFGAAGLVVGLLATQLTSPVGSIPRRLIPYVAAFLVCAGLLAVRRLRPERFPEARRLPALVLITVFVVLTSAPNTITSFAETVGPAVAGAEPTYGPSSRYISPDEQVAAEWLQENSGVDDVVATNVFCAPTPYVPGCRHVAFWVAGLTERQLYYGAWAYTAESLSAYPTTDVDYQVGPAPRQDRVDLSLQAITAPTAPVIDRLREEGVRWIYADSRATEVSPDLEQYATLAYSNADVSIYRLPD